MATSRSPASHQATKPTARPASATTAASRRGCGSSGRAMTSAVVIPKSAPAPTETGRACALARPSTAQLPTLVSALRLRDVPGVRAVPAPARDHAGRRSADSLTAYSALRAVTTMIPPYGQCAARLGDQCAEGLSSSRRWDLSDTA